MMAAVHLSRPRPLISSPLASAPGSSHDICGAPTASQRRTGQFPTSRALRPFASISHVLQPPKSKVGQDKKPPVKLIEPPQNQRVTFLLDLTQAELSRQE